MENAIGSILGVDQHRNGLAPEASRLRREFASCGAEPRRGARQATDRARMRLGDLAVDDPTPAEIGERTGTIAIPARSTLGSLRFASEIASWVM